MVPCPGIFKIPVEISAEVCKICYNTNYLSFELPDSGKDGKSREVYHG